MVWNNMIPKKGVSYEKESNTDFIHCIVHGAAVRKHCHGKCSKEIIEYRSVTVSELTVLSAALQAISTTGISAWI